VFKSILDLLLLNSTLDIKQNETQTGVVTRVKGDEYEYKWKNYKSFNRTIVFKVINLLTGIHIKEWDNHLKLPFETMNNICTMQTNKISLIIYASHINANFFL